MELLMTAKDVQGAERSPMVGRIWPQKAQGEREDGMTHEVAGCQIEGCDLCAAYGQGYAAGKDAAYSEVMGVLFVGHARGCGCAPCTVVRKVHVGQREPWSAVI